MSDRGRIKTNMEVKIAIGNTWRFFITITTVDMEVKMIVIETFSLSIWMKVFIFLNLLILSKKHLEISIFWNYYFIPCISISNFFLHLNVKFWSTKNEKTNKHHSSSSLNKQQHFSRLWFSFDFIIYLLDMNTASTIFNMLFIFPSLNENSLETSNKRETSKDFCFSLHEHILRLC